MAEQQQHQTGGRIVVCHKAGTSSGSGDTNTNANRLEQRYTFEYNGHRVYDFEQTLDEMKLFVKPPPSIQSAKQIKCVIGPSHLKLGLVSGGNNSNSSSQPQTWYLNEDTYNLVDVDESTWTFEDDDDVYNNSNDGSSNKKVIVIYLIKARRGMLWESPLKGNPNAVNAAGSATSMDPIQKEQMKQSLLLQRFQEENPGFDFSGAEFNGAAPDAKTFMGGVKYE
mmetsp:Transcript_14165/g.34114  ORF Transcript_14165/g.34114 Transcript_14165/m.34114 type:complete len:224 (+) Transcript_14165:146-817(+)|eukprot:CAMPEP_0113470542 /NCGR_PEP_ID=MMETSP0014_2-20120614/16498_1 /TAXON_ID=2857 /ORGANISM="Nitzschia sp." /LENGTH=223 /DNA_ID=CAMNT_0000363113 /DNA_START=31 /DNA_END=702 /DNA_ORIENTATION=- /assembly_acc=CAM_ASM_000159